MCAFAIHNTSRSISLYSQQKFIEWQPTAHSHRVSMRNMSKYFRFMLLLYVDSCCDIFIIKKVEQFITIIIDKYSSQTEETRQELENEKKFKYIYIVGIK